MTQNELDEAAKVQYVQLFTVLVSNLIIEDEKVALERFIKGVKLVQKAKQLVDEAIMRARI